MESQKLEKGFGNSELCLNRGLRGNVKDQITQHARRMRRTKLPILDGGALMYFAAASYPAE